MTEPQYREALEAVRAAGAAKIGEIAAWAYMDDPKHLAFTLARYKFVAKMLDGKARVLEVGAGDAWASRVVRQACGYLLAVDCDEALVRSALASQSPQWPIEVREHDMAAGPLADRFDAVFALDVLEHIPPARAFDFIRNCRVSLSASGVMVVGMPSLESQAHASEHSRRGHVNCMTQEAFRAAMLPHFANVFMFSMNDEVVHTGHAAMSHYNIAVCC